MRAVPDWAANIHDYADRRDARGTAPRAAGPPSGLAAHIAWLAMQVSHLTFTARARTRVTFPGFRAAAIRGALGHALRRGACANLTRACAQCDGRYACAYSVLFESPIPPGAAMMRRYTCAPHPFVVEAGVGARAAYDPGEAFRFSVVLIGAARRFTPALVDAVREMGHDGIGLGRGQFDRVDVGVSNADTCRGGGAASCCCIDLLTPTRIKHGGQLRGDLEFHMLLRSLLRRVSALEHFYGDGLDADFAARVRAAEQVETVESSLRWVELSRYSTRQRRAMRLGGVVGRLRCAGVAPELWPFLRAGELVHVGKAATFGLGQMKAIGARHGRLAAGGVT